ncbi:hypothetical protein AB6A40_003576 [Gnathostoma spinigerum]|uniref:Ubiquitin-protein ligase E3B n=1 Tax=Gnathostoma spinigerum TaxID=75299 RepID=A0ABD6EJX5_9BILA
MMFYSAEVMNEGEFASDTVSTLREDEEFIIALQRHCRGFLGRRNFIQKIYADFDGIFNSSDINFSHCETQPDWKMILKVSQMFLKRAQYPAQRQRLVQLCRYLIKSTSSTDIKRTFIALFLSKNYIQSASHLISVIFLTIPGVIDKLQINKFAECESAVVLIHFLLSFSSCSGWALARQNPSFIPVLNELCCKIVDSTIAEKIQYSLLGSFLTKSIDNGRPVLNVDAYNALFCVLFKIVKNTSFSPSAMLLFVQNCLVSPALLMHLSTSSIDLLVRNSVFAKSLSIITSNRTCIINSLNGNQSLFLLANLIQLGHIDQNGLVECLIDWTEVMYMLLIRCDDFIVKEKGDQNYWHPIFGWYCESIDQSIEDSFPLVSKQLRYLWSKSIISCLFNKALLSHQNRSSLASTASTSRITSPIFDSSIQKLLKKFNNLRTETQSGTGSAHQLSVPSLTAIVCLLYHNAILIMSNLHSDILAGLCREDFLLPQLWMYNASLSPADSGLSYYLSLLGSGSPLSYFAPLILFANCATSVISILDEEEMYEKGGPFCIKDLCDVADFCNKFCFRVIWNDLLNEDVSQALSSPLFSSVYQLCMLLYNRDCRRSFTPNAKFWIAQEVKGSVIMNELEKRTERAQFLISKMSHLVSLQERIVLFRKYIRNEKESLGGSSSTMITVARTRVLEDGFRQLANLSSIALKGTVRVKFVNQQGLDEAGIDQQGVFKEFLELILKRVFHPDLNLFKSSPSGVLFPSTTSHLHENHLSLFQFVGKMLAKAIYEGIVSDVQLAPVLLATVLGRQLCAFDELSQLDPDLYKNLLYIKHYHDTGDVADLSLTFSVDDSSFGFVQTHDLIRCGRAIQVTNENKFLYVHRMAQYRVFDQTKAQCQAFVAGFLSVLNIQWLSLFAPHELQFMISGQSSDVDLHDLRKHVQYYGGFHSNHRLIKWLWQILENDFSIEERHLFLKFVTSCSRAPLLGFAYLEPPFSIRCVEVGDDQDQGDTLASVVRGFLAIKRTTPSRLPTASTCFNLLKLPNYSRKSILLQKLRYAIHSETGFELS